MENENRSQTAIILAKLQKDGVVTNLWAIQHYILRLGARIIELRKAGYNIETVFNTLETGKNCHYYLKAKPTLF